MIPQEYIYREMFLVLVFTLVAYSIIVHPLLLQLYLKNYSVSELPSDAEIQPSKDGAEFLDGLPPVLVKHVGASAWGLAAIAGVIAGVVFCCWK